VAGQKGRTLGERHLPLREQVLVALRERIVDGSYAPGERLTEDRLAADFGVSRNPVREALRTAEAEGFVRVLPRRGVVVASPDESAVRDLFVVRARLEPLAARLAATRASTDDVAGLRALLAEAEVATRTGDLAEVARLNSALHRRVIDVGGNVWLSALTGPLYRHVQWVFRLGAARRAPHSWSEHVRLVEAIAAGDPDAAERAAEQHVRAAAGAASTPDRPDGTGDREQNGQPYGSAE
jgi:DNA-binding GntR family transcriptional regulator